MDKRKTEDKKRIKIITRGYVQALFLIIVLVIVNQIIDEGAFSIILVIIVLMLLIMFLRAQKSLIKSFDYIEECRDNMLNLFQAVPVAMFLIEEDTTNVLLMNQISEELTKNIKSNKELNFADIIQCKATDSCDVIFRMKSNEKNENIEIVIPFNEDEYMDYLLSSEKLTFKKKSAILVGLFDISKLKKETALFKERAIFDELTGLYNRHYLDEKMKEAMDNSDRYKEPLSILIMDLDHFKRVNDTWGHPMGDDVLKQTAQIAKENIRKMDIPVRFGGEEFLIVLPHTDINGAYETAEKIRLALQENIHSVVGKYTASFGVAEKREEESFNSLYKRVDEALYLAKEGGRNRVVSAEGKENLPIASVRFVFRSEWESGDQGVDDQHRELLDIANSLIFMSLSHDKFDKTLDQLEIFIRHLVDHYIYEELFLVEGEYPNHQEHVDVHHELMEKLLRLKESYQNKELKASALFSFILDEVIVGHIIKTDAKFIQYFKDNAQT